MLRWSVMTLALALALPLGVAVAGEETKPGGDDVDTPTLTAKEVARYFEPYAPAVRRCYIDHARSKTAEGTLRLELIIHSNGSIFKFGYAAPGVVAPHLARLDRCLRKLPPTWRFPVRRGFTSAVIPFLFVRVHAPGAGPIESCWDPKGCPDAGEAK